MFSPQFYPSRRGCLTLVTLALCALCPPRLEAQAPPADQVPDAVRGVKVYQLPEKGGKPAPNPAVYKSLEFKDVNFDRLLLGLIVSIRPVDRPAMVEHMYFQNVQVNGIPVHIETSDREFKLSNKQAVDVPAPLECSVIFDDLDSMKPVRDMVDKDTIQITGQSFIEVRLNTMEKLALRAKQVVIPVDLHEQVPLNFFRGSPVLRLTADSILDTLANPSSTAAINMAKEHLAKMRLDEALGGKAKPALYLLCTVFTIRDPKSQASEQFSQTGTGFLVSADGKLVTAKRVISPWLFDPQMDFLIEQQHLELVKESVKTYAWPAGAQVMAADGQPDFQSALSTEKQSLKILQKPPDVLVEQEYQDPDSEQKATLHLHEEGASDVALLQLTGTGFQPLVLSDPSACPAPKLVLCSYPFGLSQPQTAPRLLTVQLTVQGSILRMEHKADPGESGAPLLDADGKVVALATSTDQCISIQAARKLIP